jgi:hypothetical protein
MNRIAFAIILTGLSFNPLVGEISNFIFILLSAVAGGYLLRSLWAGDNF